MSSASEVRKFARQKYIEPAIERRERKVQIRAGDVHKQLTLKNRVPLVCQALASEIFLKENNLVLEAKEGPPSGLSTRVVFTYRLVYEEAGTKLSSGGKPGANAERPRNLLRLLELKGIGKEVFASLGGGENFIRGERKAFADALEKQDRERGLL